MDLKEYIRSIPDYPKKGILFRDITTLIKNEKAFSETINQIVERSKKVKFDKIAAIESRGFVFASAVSYILKKPFVMLRKKNKLPADVHSIDFELEYGTATIEVHKDSIDENDEVLIIDDLIATGGTAEAAAKLVEISKGKVAAFIFVINLFDLNGTDKLIKKGDFDKAKAIIKNAVAKGSDVIFVTARADLDDRELFLDTFRAQGIKIDNVHVVRAGNIGLDSAAKNKEVVFRKYLRDGKYKRIRLFDDHVENLYALLKLRDEFPDVTFEAYRVKKDGSAKKMR